MIEPLRNKAEFGSRDEAEAARLLSAWGPVDPLPAVEQRVYASLGRPRRIGPRALRVAIVTSVSIMTTAIMAMTMGIVLHRGAQTRAPLPTPPSRSVSPVEIAPRVPPVALSPTLEAQTELPVPVRAQPRANPESQRAPVAGRRRIYAPVDSAPETAPVPSAAPVPDPVDTTEARVAAAPPEEAALVLAGLRAFRRQHDPVQAGVLLDRYLSRFPQGALVQEALALAIEASLARGDRPAASQWAQQYLQAFPSGRFVRLARKAVGSTGP